MRIAWIRSGFGPKLFIKWPPVLARRTSAGTSPRKLCKTPKFQFTTDALTLENGLLEEFTSAYGDPRIPLSPSGLKASLIALNKIFGSMREQTNDNLLLAFLDELESEVKNLILEDFPFRKQLNSEPKKLDGLAKQLKDANHFFGSISDQAVAEILNIGSSSLAKFRENARNGLLKRSDLSVDSGPVVAKISRIIDREFKKLGIFEIVSEFVGIDYRFTGMSLELSYEGSTWWRDAIGNEKAPKTMYAHLDESIFAPKSIVYLSDVRSENGPTSIYPRAYPDMNNNPLQDIVGRVVGKVGSSSSSKLYEYYKKTYHQSAGSPNFREHFMRLPENIRFNSHLGWEVLPDSELEKELSSREIEMLGPAGTFVVFDGSNLLHRGGLIEKGERVVLQVVFYPGNRWNYRFKLLFKKLKNLITWR